MARRRWRCAAEVKSRKGYQKKRSRSHKKEFVRGGADPNPCIRHGKEQTINSRRLLLANRRFLILR